MEDNEKLILVVDDESSIRRNVSDLLTPLGYSVITAENGDVAIDTFKEEVPGLVILDINLPGKNGLQVLEEIKALNKDIPVIMFTAFGTSERAIKAMKSGAYDYIEKPFELDEFLLIIERAFQFGNLLKEVEQLRTMVDSPGSASTNDDIIGKSSKMRGIYKLIGRVATTDATILIQGESGTGKELVADALQRHSLINEKPYVKINCGAISESLLESEIFGHEKGAFTGAFTQRKGIFEIANGGTIYLDEINSMPPSLQVKLLRILQKQPFFRVGGDKPVNVNVRIIASSNKDIKAEVESGQFREDLYYRLNVVFIKVPPLRERMSDIVLLVEHFVNKFSPNCKIIVTRDTIRKLMKYNWPGNVRELENTIQSAMVTSSGEILEIGQISAHSNDDVDSADYMKMIDKGMSLKDVISFVEKKIIFDSLEKCNNNQSEVAEYLKMNRRLLYSRLKEWE
ncbi:MAG: sigma-54-dependent Fis family transcriptional regulator [Bacteroidales bacterium]|nr:sigma-54-dependent Fis family transcriptional regulator [Bacteroidales bacterium]